MKRTKEWWSRLSKEERIELYHLEHSRSSRFGAGGYIPDDCCECGYCSTPHLGTGLCQLCQNRLDQLVEKANGC